MYVVKITASQRWDVFWVQFRGCSSVVFFVTTIISETSNCCGCLSRWYYYITPILFFAWPPHFFHGGQ